MTTPANQENGRANQRGAFRALGNRNFRLFFSGQVISLTGTWMQTVAQSWLVYRLSDSALLLGLTAFAGRAPIFFFSLPAGVIADRVSKRHLVIMTQSLAMLQAAALAWLTLAETIAIWQVIVLSVILGLINALDTPARQSLIGEMVGPRDLSSAIALNSTAVNSARIVGPALAGIIVAAVGEGWCFSINSLSYLAVLIGLLMMRVGPAEPRQRDSFWRELTEGLRYVRSERSVLYPLLLMSAVSFFSLSYVVLMPIMAKNVLGRGSEGLGMLMAAAGAGSLIGAMILAGQADARRLPTLMSLASIGLAISLIAFGMSREFHLSMGILTLLGLCMMVQMASTNTHLQTVVPDHLRGRLMSFYTLVFLGVAPFGGLFAGSLAHAVSAPFTLVLGGLITLALAIPLGFKVRGRSR